MLLVVLSAWSLFAGVLCTGPGSCPQGSVYRDSSQSCIGMLVIDKTTVDNAMTPFENRQLPLMTLDSKGLSSSTVGPQMLPALAFDDVFEISIQDPVEGINLCNSWSLSAIVNLPAATTLSSIRKVTLFTITAGGGSGAVVYSAYYVDSGGSRYYYANIVTSLTGQPDLDVVLLNNDPQYPESGWLPLSMVYNNNTGYVVVTINFQQLANTSISLPDCAHVPLFVKGIGAASNKLEISGIYTLSFFNTLLEVAEVATLAGCKDVLSTTQCASCGGLSFQQSCLPLPEVFCPGSSAPGLNYTCNEATACSLSGSLPRHDNGILEGSGRTSTQFTWVITTTTVTGCHVRLKGFEIYHASTKACGFVVTMWTKISGNTYKLVGKASSISLAKATTQTFVRYFYSSPASYEIPFGQTVYFGITTTNKECRVLTAASTTKNVLYRQSAAGLISVNATRDFDKGRSQDVSFRAILEDIDECSRNVCRPFNNTYCSNTPGSVECPCNSGYSIMSSMTSPASCSDINECLMTSSNNCSHLNNTQCVNTAGSYQCPCLSGYTNTTLLPYSPCANVNECSTGSGTCHLYSNTHCIDHEGGYQCMCNHGYNSTGSPGRSNCSNVDECAMGSHNCTSYNNTICMDTTGAFECPCLQGYNRTSGSQWSSCSNINECAGDSRICSGRLPNSRCEDTDGAFQCVCNPGFNKTVNPLNTTICVDVNECTTGMHNCTSTQICNNSNGSFSCMSGSMLTTPLTLPTSRTRTDTLSTTTAPMTSANTATAVFPASVTTSQSSTTPLVTITTNASTSQPTNQATTVTSSVAGTTQPNTTTGIAVTMNGSLATAVPTSNPQTTPTLATSGTTAATTQSTNQTSPATTQSTNQTSPATTQSTNQTSPATTQSTNQTSPATTAASTSDSLPASTPMVTGTLTATSQANLTTNPVTSTQPNSTTVSNPSTTQTNSRTSPPATTPQAISTDSTTGSMMGNISNTTTARTSTTTATGSTAVPTSTRLVINTRPMSTQQVTTQVNSTTSSVATATQPTTTTDTTTSVNTSESTTASTPLVTMTATITAAQNATQTVSTTSSASTNQSNTTTATPVNTTTAMDGVTTPVPTNTLAGTTGGSASGPLRTTNPATTRPITGIATSVAGSGSSPMSNTANTTSPTIPGTTVSGISGSSTTSPTSAVTTVSNTVPTTSTIASSSSAVTSQGPTGGTAATSHATSMTSSTSTVATATSAMMTTMTPAVTSATAQTSTAAGTTPPPTTSPPPTTTPTTTTPTATPPTPPTTPPPPPTTPPTTTTPAPTPTTTPAPTPTTTPATTTPATTPTTTPATTTPATTATTTPPPPSLPSTSTSAAMTATSQSTPATTSSQPTASASAPSTATTPSAIPTTPQATTTPDVVVVTAQHSTSLNPSSQTTVTTGSTTTNIPVSIGTDSQSASSSIVPIAAGAGGGGVLLLLLIIIIVIVIRRRSYQGQADVTVKLGAAASPEFTGFNNQRFEGVPLQDMSTTENGITGQGDYNVLSRDLSTTSAKVTSTQGDYSRLSRNLSESSLTSEEDEKGKLLPLYSRPKLKSAEEDVYHTLTRPVDDSQPYTDPPDNVEELYSHLQTANFRQLDRKDVRVGKELGKGEFGVVTDGMLKLDGKTVPIAIKVLKDTKAEAKRTLLQEAALMGQFNHSNVVRLLGVVTAGEPVLVVLELMSGGDLRSYLTAIQPEYGHAVASHVPQLLVRMAAEIASGMDYLAKRQFVHRDLAARNIMLDGSSTCKIGDFGMSRNLANDTYYESHGGRIPIKWTAPEALLYHKYSTHSDVWSYGVVLFEIFTIGKKPFVGMSPQRVIAFVSEQNKRLSPPPGIGRNLYKIMLDCWHPDHHKRPSFEHIVQQLSTQGLDLLLASKQGKGRQNSSILGGPLHTSEGMYRDLQSMYLNCTRT